MHLSFVWASEIHIFLVFIKGFTNDKYLCKSENNKLPQIIFVKSYWSLKSFLFTQKIVQVTLKSELMKKGQNRANTH